MIIRDSEFQFDRHKLTLYFEADKRIDFRDLVSDLFALYKTRIWMQQIDMSFRPDEEASKSLRTGISIPNREVSCNFYNSESETLRVSDTCTFDGDFGGFETPQNQGQLFYQNMSPNHPQSNFSVVSDTDSNMSLQSGLNKNFSSLPIIRDRINETVVSEPDTDSNLALNRDFKFDSDVGFFPSYGKHH
jgi:hypothetical protein